MAWRHRGHHLGRLRRLDRWDRRRRQAGQAVVQAVGSDQKVEEWAICWDRCAHHFHHGFLRSDHHWDLRFPRRLVLVVTIVGPKDFGRTTVTGSFVVVLVRSSLVQGRFVVKRHL